MYRCNVRVCRDCGAAYQKRRQKRYQPLSRLRTDSKDHRARFLTMTFQNVAWATPEQSQAWVQERSEALRLFLRPKACRACRWHEKRCRCRTGPPLLGKTGRPLKRQRGTCRRCLEASRACEDPRSCARVRWRVRGYLASWETTLGRDGLYHPHLHLVTYSGYIPFRQLREHWMERFGAWNCDVKSLRDGPRALAYVMKYIGKPWNLHDEVQIAGFYRVRRLLTSGLFYGREMDRLVMGAQAELGACRAHALERSIVRLCCERCGFDQPDVHAIAHSERHRRECESLHGPPHPDGWCVCGAWRCPADWVPFGKAWKPRREWITDPECDEPVVLEHVPDSALPATMMLCSWSGAMLWDEAQMVDLTGRNDTHGEHSSAKDCAPRPNGATSGADAGPSRRQEAQTATLEAA